MLPFNPNYNKQDSSSDKKSKKLELDKKIPLSEIKDFISNQPLNELTTQALGKIIDFYEDKISKYKNEIRVLQDKKEGESKQKIQKNSPLVPIEAKEPSLDNEKEVRIRLWYEAQRKFLSTIPKDVDELKQTVISLVISSKKTRLTEDDFRMYFYDYDSEKCIVETESDFESVMAMAAKATPPVLKLCIDIRRGINSVESDEENKSWRIKEDYNCKNYIEESDEEEDIEKFYILDFELEYHSIMREGYVYVRRYPYSKNKLGSQICLFVWAEWKNIAEWCSGRWETKPLLFNGEFGRLQVSHSLPPQKHKWLSKQTIAEKYSEYMVPNSKANDVILTRDEWSFLIKELIRKDLSLTPVEIIVKIKTNYPNAILPDRRFLNRLISVERDKSLRVRDNMGMVDVSAIKTLRNTDFGREIGFSLVENQPKYFLYLYSDFQKQVADEWLKDQHFHLFVDGTFKWCPKVFAQLLNIWVFHREKKLYIPICHILMQTQKYDGYIYALNWIKDTFKLNPWYVTVDFEVALIRAVHDVFPNATLVPWFFHFVKWLWNNAQRCGLQKRKLVPETKQLIFSLKSLAFKPPTRVLSNFQHIQKIYSKRGICFNSFLEYFETTWIDGTFQIKDWNYHEKLSEFEDLAITNNGLESFHQIIRSQLKRVTPSFRGFIEVISRAETLKKADYDEDRINGDPQYNRCWPVTKILKELYAKES